MGLRVHRGAQIYTGLYINIITVTVNTVTEMSNTAQLPPFNACLSK